jgi:hypothetical protein
MARVVVMYWYEFKSVDGVTVEGVSAECPRCGLRVFSEGTRKTDVVRCTRLLSENCGRGEANRYTIRVLRKPRNVEAGGLGTHPPNRDPTEPSHPD